MAAFALIAVALLVLWVGPWLLRGLGEFRAAGAINTVQAMLGDLPVLIKVPTLTPTLTPSITPSPTNTPTITPSPSATPSPTLTSTPTPTPTVTPTATPSPTSTRTRRPATPTQPPPTPTPLPVVAAPSLLEPEDGSSYGRDDIFRLAWQSAYTPKAGECFLLTVGYVQNGSEVELDMCMQERHWWVNDGLYLQADQETGRAYQWWVTVVREETDGDGNVRYVPVGPSSEKWTFYWR